MKRRLLAESEEEEAAPPAGADNTNGKGPAKVPAVAGIAMPNERQSPLVQLLQKCGFKVSSSATSAHGGDSSSIRVFLEKELRHFDAARMKTITLDLRSLLRQPSFLQASLQPIALPSSGASRTEAQSMHLGARDESLVKLFLNIPALQLATMETLLEQMPLLQHQSINSEEPLSMLRLALAQFRWLDIALVDSQGLANKLVELLKDSPDATLQREVISLIPDVIDDSTQGVYVEALSALCVADSSLRLTVIDTLGNLNLAAKYHEDVRRLSLEALHAARDDEIPILVRFIMQSADTVEELRPLMRELRTNIAPSQQSSSPQGLVLEAMKVGFQMNKYAVTAYVKELGALSAGDARPVDVWFLIALLSLAHHRKVGESAIKKLAGAQLLTATVLREAIKGHAQTLQPYFSVLLNLSDRLVRSSEAAERDIGVELAVLCFRQFAGSSKQVGYHQQEVVGNLVSHIGSSVRAEVDASLTALSRLCSEDAVAVTAYASTLKGILEYLDGLSDTEVCRTFEILSLLSLSKDKRSVEIADALEMLIHKHLASNSLRDRRVGVLGAVAMLRLPTGTLEQKHRSSMLLAQLLVPARRAYSQPFALEFAYDELVSLVREKGPLAEEIKATLREPFESTFVIFGDASVLHSEEERWWNQLEDKATVDAACNVMPLVQSPRRPELTWLAAQFRLLMSCCSEADRINDWAALVGCPMQMFPRGHLQPSDFNALTPSAQTDCCAALFYAHSWFRELLNAFTPLCSNSPEVRRMLLARLGVMPELEATLTRLANLCKWQPPSGEDKPVGVPSAKGRGRPPKNDEGKAEDASAVSSSTFERFFRPLDPLVALLLVYSTPDQTYDDESLYTQKPPPPTSISTAALRTVISALLAPLTTPVARKMSTREQDAQRRLPPAIGVIKSCVVPTLAALRAHCTNLLKQMEAALEDERIALLSVISLSFSLLERSILLSAPDPALQQQVFAAWHGGTDKHVTRAELERVMMADFASWAERVKDLSTAVAVLNAAVALEPLSPVTSAVAQRRSAVRASLSKLAENLLANQDLASSKARPEHLRLLLSVWVRYADDSLNTLYSVATSVLPLCAAQDVASAESGELKNGPAAQHFPFLKLATFPIFYRAALQELALVCATLGKQLDNDVAGDTALPPAAVAANTFQALIDLLKAHHSSRSAQSAALRYGKAVVEASIRWFPALSRLFGTKSKLVSPVVRALQQGARPLQNLCADGKAKKDAALVALVPLTRKSLETMVYKIKALCAANAFDPSAYHVANLRHKTVAGAEVSSQPAVEEAEPAKRKRSTKKVKKNKEVAAEEEEGDKEREGKRDREGSGEVSDSDHRDEERGKADDDDDDDEDEMEEGGERDGEEEGEEENVEECSPSPKKERRRKRVVSDGEDEDV